MKTYTRKTEEKPSFSFHTMELNRVLSYEEYLKIKDTSYKSGCRVFQRNGKIESYQFSPKGIILYLYRNDKGIHNMDLRVNPRKVLGDFDYYGIFEPSETNVKKIIPALSTLLRTSELGDLDKYKTSRIDFCRNAEVEPTVADDYMNLIYRACPAYSFEKELHFNEGEADRDGIYFRSKLLEIYAYQKTKQLEKIGLLEDLPADSAVLRFEIRIKRKKIRDLEKESRNNSLENLLNNIADYSRDSFKHYMPRLFRMGRYRRYANGIELIDESRFHEQTKQLMRNLFTEASRKHDFQNAIESFVEVNDVNPDKLLELLRNFDEIDLNPIPLNQRCCSGRNELSSIPVLLGLKKGSTMLPFDVEY